jgi:predicted RNA binding protein YcfA (HicA-like mRNA interferase family)
MFFKKVPELTYREVVKGLKSLNFKKQKNKSTAHEQWETENPFRKVTVDKHLSPFSRKLVHAMAKQAEVDVREFCRRCKE